jgi:hypothetical protein
MFSPAATIANEVLSAPWSEKQQGVDPSLPLNRWYELATFDSSADCEARKLKVLQEMDEQIQEPTPGKLVTTERLRHQANQSERGDVGWLHASPNSRGDRKTEGP